MAKKPIDLINEQLRGGREWNGRQIPHLCLISRPAFEKMKASIPSSPNELAVDTIYGIPFEVFNDAESMVKRAKELHEAGKAVLIVDE